ncbi:MAG: polymer-forming cytoskeletal protein [Chloroflexota bacterium]|nr:polymer-forming cytoskeletal protein [Chloroflexota bacterium]MDE2947574.1 polymer-forming cytoskeletal protein [Chloroflexota bacterium]
MSAFFTNRRGQTDTEAQASTPEVSTGRPVGFDTIIGSNTSFEGIFASSGNVRMDGQFAGSLEISGNILVGESADIHADINARNISIAGSVRGNVTGNKVQLLRTGRIWGDINASALTTEEGAFIDGKISMAGHSATSDDELAENEDIPEAEPGADAAEDLAQAELALEGAEATDQAAEELADRDNR